MKQLKQQLQINYDSIVSEIEPKPLNEAITEMMLKKGVLDIKDLEDIGNVKTRAERVTSLIDFVLNSKDPTCGTVFMESVKLNYEWLWNKISTCDITTGNILKSYTSNCTGDKINSWRFLKSPT